MFGIDSEMSFNQDNQLYVYNHVGFDVDSVVSNRVNQENSGSGFYVCCLSDVIKKYDQWIEKIPRVKPFYAVKCNDDSMVLKTLAGLGSGFDCATKNEIKNILSMGVSADRIIFANTTKIADHIQYAKEVGVRTLTFDNEDEIYKIHKLYPEANLVLRFRFSSDKAIYKLGKKFGCEPQNEASELLRLTKELNLNVIGLSFHIGSSCEDYDVYCGAIRAARRIFMEAQEIGYNFSLLDIGGGFPGDNFETINVFSNIINNSLTNEFPIHRFPNLRIISEPGTYFVKSAFTLAAQIHSRKFFKSSTGDIKQIMYYLNEGVYSAFLFIPLGPETIEPKALKHRRSNTKYSTIIWGPTCDSTDKICDDITLEKMEVNDWLYFECMGAYTYTLRTPFNDLPETKILHYINQTDLERMKGKISNKVELINGKCKQKIKLTNGITC